MKVKGKNKDFMNLVDPVYSYEEIAKVMGISRQRVKQIEQSAIKKLSKADLKEKWDIIRELKQYFDNKEG